MKSLVSMTGFVFLSVVFGLSSCAVQDDKAVKPAAPPAPAPVAKAPPAEKAPEKAKATKVAGDIGLLDLEKNYLILVTKDGKLVTLDFDQKIKATQITPTAGKIADIGLGSSATVTYTSDKGKNVATGIEYKAAKGGD
jgi:hypothetical protein